MKPRTALLHNIALSPTADRIWSVCVALDLSFLCLTVARNCLSIAVCQHVVGTEAIRRWLIVQTVDIISFLSRPTIANKVHHRTALG